MTDTQNEQDKQTVEFEAAKERLRASAQYSLNCDCDYIGDSSIRAQDVLDVLAALSHAAQARPTEASLREELAGLQAIIAKKDRALELAAYRIKRCLENSEGANDSDHETLEQIERAVALTSPSAALEAVRAEDRAKLARYENMEPTAWYMSQINLPARIEDGVSYEESRTGIVVFNYDDKKEAIEDGFTDEEALFTHPKE